MIRGSIITALAFIAMTGLAFGQSVESASVEDLQREISQLREDLAKVRKDLDEVRNLAPVKALIVENRPLDMAVDVSGFPAIGQATSPLTIVEFSDFQCPYCGRHSRDTYPALKENYVDSGQLKYVFMDYPLPNHPNAPAAAEAAHCAQEQGQFWAMHDVLFSNQSNLGASDLPQHAASVGLDAAKFDECLGSGRYADRVEKGKSVGEALGVRGTPSFGLGYTSSDGKSVRIVKMIRGAQPITAFAQGIEELLEDAAGSN